MALTEECRAENATHGIYYFYKKKLNAVKADRRCKDDHNATLAVLNTAEKFMDAADFFPSFASCGVNEYRIGLKQTKEQSKSYWITGQEFVVDGQKLTRGNRLSFNSEAYGELKRASYNIELNEGNKQRPFLCYKPHGAVKAASETESTTEEAVITVAGRVYRESATSATKQPTTMAIAASATATNTGMVAGLAVLGISLFICLVALVVYLARKRQLQKQPKSRDVRSSNVQAIEESTYASVVESPAVKDNGSDATYSFATLQPTAPAGPGGVGGMDATGDVCYSSVTAAGADDVTAPKAPDVYAQVHKEKKKVADVYSEVKKPKSSK